VARPSAVRTDRPSGVPACLPPDAGPPRSTHRSAALPRASPDTWLRRTPRSPASACGASFRDALASHHECQFAFFCCDSYCHSIYSDAVVRCVGDTRIADVTRQRRNTRAAAKRRGVHVDDRPAQGWRIRPGVLVHHGYTLSSDWSAAWFSQQWCPVIAAPLQLRTAASMIGRCCGPSHAEPRHSPFRLNHRRKAGSDRKGAMT